MCKISQNGLTASNEKGYRLVKSTHGIYSGTYFYEAFIHDRVFHSHKSNLSYPANIRIGWAQISADLQAPCGYDEFGYSWRLTPGTVFHKSLGHSYGDDGYKGGDYIGVMIKLVKDIRPFPEWKKNQIYESGTFKDWEFPINEGSEIRYFRNGVDLGVAFNNLNSGKYHAAVSLFNGGKVTLNFGDEPFKYPPPDSFAAKPFSSIGNSLKMHNENISHGN